MAAPKEHPTDWAVAPHNAVVFKRKAAWNGIRLRHMRVRWGETPEHSHTDHHITIPIEGIFTARLHTSSGNSLEGVGRLGSTCIVPAGQLFSARAESEIEYVSLFIAPSLVDRIASDGRLSGRVDLVEACDARDPIIRQIGLALMVEGEHQQPAGQLYAESLSNLLAVHLFRHYSRRSLSEARYGGLSGHRLRRATEFMLDNLERDLGLAEISNEVDLSPYHFARAFKQTVGLTPHQYVTNARIERAKALLSGTELSIVDVGLATGFKSQSHFTTLFRRLTSMTPKTYRDITRG